MIFVVAALAGIAAALLPAPQVRPHRARTTRSVPFRPIAAGVVLYVVVGGIWGVALGVVGALVLSRRSSSPRTFADESWSGAASVVVELIAVAIRAGVPPEQAVAVAADAVGPPHSEGLAQVVERWRYGLSARDVHLDTPSRLIAQGIEQAQDSGAAPAVALEHVAADLAADAAVRAQERARRVGVQAAVPLGVCLLPAFLLIAVVPLVASLVSAVAP